MAEIKIECPKCRWKPKADSLWSCTCGHAWNTFDTAARCPACHEQWRDTQCLSTTCAAWSKHLDWYKNLDDIFKKEIESISEPIHIRHK